MGTSNDGANTFANENLFNWKLHNTFNMSEQMLLNIIEELSCFWSHLNELP
jgi:hypothetical protein